VLIDRLRNPDLSHVRYGSDRGAGALATAAWLRARGLSTPGAAWDVSIALDVADRPATAEADAAKDTRFHLLLAPAEWGFFFCHGGRSSWIRVTEVPSVFERDDFALLPRVPPLRDLGTLVRGLEEQHQVQFKRHLASIRTSIAGADAAIRLWVAASI